ncbi:aminotransferase [Croceicoccus estronivorus]|uniref:cysteine desulfurase family protein n=1 Tax=Croceicoccus estronivorus TaxID=1172626 RepID=UPI00083278F1|nr:aminotransferase class V-fold PLP-dependent enzyme [Croceicoccus estronivorus]OCC22680.1 aminotransferase [Croceicoccus estronivorus]
MRIYFDHAATTPVRPEAQAAVAEGLARWANPSSPHGEGRAARAALEDARVRIGKALGWNGEVILTSGASESAVIALTRAKGGARLASAVEHESVLRALPEAGILPVMANGALDLEALGQALNGQERAVVAVQAVNSETGNRQDIQAIAAVVHDAGGLLIVDAAQSAGKWPVPAEADMVIVSAHKLGGPPGVGALLVKDFAQLEASGGQERGYRRGTENLPGALGFAAALEACSQPYCDPAVLAPIVEILAPAMGELGGTRLATSLADPTPYVEALAMPGLSGSAQLMRFDMAGFAVSQGSACSSGSLKRSHVLEAMGLDTDIADRTIRVSFGWNTRKEEVEAFCAAWIAMARDAKARAA